MSTEEQRSKPPKGIVQPPFIPPSNKALCNTNQLQFIESRVLKPLMKLNDAWPFYKPVDPVEADAPDYYDVIDSPMDFSTIKKRLANKWYSSAEECKLDFRRVFDNCYRYNNEEQDIYGMAKEVEVFYEEKMALMPYPEVDVPLRKATNCPRHCGKLSKKSQSIVARKKLSRKVSSTPSKSPHSEERVSKKSSKYLIESQERAECAKWQRQQYQARLSMTRAERVCKEQPLKEKVSRAENNTSFETGMIRQAQRSQILEAVTQPPKWSGYAAVVASCTRSGGLDKVNLSDESSNPDS